MSYVGKEQIQKAKEVDLISYLKAYEPDELVHISGENYCTKTHDSLKISNGKWNWFSRGTTLKLLSGDKWRSENYLSLAGVFHSSNKIPPALEQYLSVNKQVENIVLHLDNDKAGRDATRAIIDKFMGNYTIIDEPPQSGKDINEQLKIMLKIQQRKEYER